VEEGYVYAYVANEDPTQIYTFVDDISITYTPSSIIQVNEYYPFGMQTFRSCTRTGATQNNYLANGGAELNTASALYELTYRNYDPALGRFHQIDPLADRYGSKPVLLLGLYLAGNTLMQLHTAT